MRSLQSLQMLSTLETWACGPISNFQPWKDLKELQHDILTFFFCNGEIFKRTFGILSEYQNLLKSSLYH